MPRYRRAAILGLLTGAIGLAFYFSPVGRAGEDEALSWLFALRGPIDPPTEVVVVDTQTTSPREPGVAGREAELPRASFAALIERLAREGASAIVLDVAFDRPGPPEEDRALASAVRRAGRVVLFQQTHRESFDWGWTARLLPPIPELADAAAGLAPHVLPKVPARVSEVWTFLPAAGGTPTLPVVALQVHALETLDRLVALLRKTDPEAARELSDHPLAAGADELRGVMQVLRRAFTTDPILLKRFLNALGGDAELSGEERGLLAALARVYAGSDSRYLNLYGPPGTIRTISHRQVLEGQGPPSGELGLRGTVVFVGLSELRSAEQPDSYHTAYSTSEGIDVSGVELAATAFGNLLTDRTVRPAGVWPSVGLLVGLGFILAVSSLIPSELGSALAGVTLGASYLGLAHLLFREHGLWLPLFVPVVIQIPLALGLGLFSRSIVAKRVTAYFLPEKLARQLQDGIAPAAAGELAYGTCLATDAEHYTTVSEGMDPRALASLMNEYFARLGKAVVHHHGDISEVTADSMMCTWTARQEDAATRQEACLAALELVEAADQFNRSHDLQLRLPTRVGLHSGQLVLGNVGACGHFAYQVVGDIANTASRIQGLCKQFRTRVLASEVVVSGLHEIFVRRLGRFRLVGKTNPLTIYEVVAQRQLVAEAELRCSEAFAGALEAFEAGRWSEAGRRFDVVLSDFPTDGPARFYARQCRLFLASPPTGTDYVIELETK
jgi:adenylate cyclase